MTRTAKRILRWSLLTLVLVALAVGLVAWWLPGYVERELLRRLDAAGLGPATGQLVALTPRGLAMRDLRLGEGGWITVDSLTVGYSPGTLWDGGVDVVQIGGLRAGEFSVASISLYPALDGWQPSGEHELSAFFLRYRDTSFTTLDAAFDTRAPDELRVSRLSLLGGDLGEITLDPTTLNLADHTARVTLRITGADLAEVLRLTLGDAATGTGHLDGAITARVRVTPPYRFLIRDGRLRATESSHLVVHDQQGLRSLLGASVTEPRVRDELVVALSDFTATRLEASIDPVAGAPLRLRLVGRGGPIGRPVDLTLSVTGVGDVGNTRLFDYLLETPRAD